jgi:hypothetical protein
MTRARILCRSYQCGIQAIPVANPKRMFKRRKSELLSVPDFPKVAAAPEPESESSVHVQALEAELAKVWGEIAAVRFEARIPEPLRELEIVRLMALQNKLDAEIQRQSEAHLANFVKCLRLEEIGGHATLLGGIHRAIDSRASFRRRANSGVF